MTYIDAAILNVFERLCHRFQILTGRTNLWLAFQLTNLSIIIYFVWTAVSFWNSDVIPRVALTVFCVTLLYALTQTVLKEPLEAYEQTTYRRLSKGLGNPRRVRDALLRISFLSLSVVLGYPVYLVYITLHQQMMLLGYLLLLLTTVVLYVLACDPLPPCEGKVWEWLRSFARGRLAHSESSSRG